MGNRNPRYSNGSRRRKLRCQLLAEQDVCALCGQPIDRSLVGVKVINPKTGKLAPHPMAPEVDEIVPVSRGGSPTDKRNVQLVHRACNRRKSNHMPGDNSASHHLPLPHSRQW
jgi:5-methylcytosine-specific restriction endonuclease McrA